MLTEASKIAPKFYGNGRLKPRGESRAAATE